MPQSSDGEPHDSRACSDEPVRIEPALALTDPDVAEETRPRRATPDALTLEASLETEIRTDTLSQPEQAPAPPSPSSPRFIFPHPTPGHTSNEASSAFTQTPCGRKSESRSYKKRIKSSHPQLTRSYPGSIIIDEAKPAIEEGQRAGTIHQSEGEIYMFVDASTDTKEGSGIGIVYRRDTMNSAWTEISETLVDLKDSNHGEAAALATGIEHFDAEFGQDPSVKGLTALTDSEGSLLSVQRHEADPSLAHSPNLMKKYTQKIHEATLKLLKLGKTVTLRWTKGHGSGKQRVEGNVRADALARSANPGIKKRKDEKKARQERMKEQRRDLQAMRRRERGAARLAAKGYEPNTQNTTDAPPIRDSEEDMRLAAITDAHQRTLDANLVAYDITLTYISRVAEEDEQQQTPVESTSGKRKRDEDEDEDTDTDEELPTSKKLRS
ncbi:hypothetical protein DIS24_g8886 [Lasiodiplodia hormozganensis]|uniref:RNase H type-1 domain-containing protein n=1 Tax=Lasiodiplodia hormozganensis TaxID=869390 RepID=A0AA40CL67_9PEZI|nr:hypothetical protein DIS24_g8886 [Lasiodiplodia hormozganensis]